MESSKTLIQIASSMLINDIAPRLKKGGKIISPRLGAFLVNLKYEGRLSHIQLRQILDAEMFNVDPMTDDEKNEYLKELRLDITY